MKPACLRNHALVVLGVGWVLLLWSGRAAADEPARRPNVVLILADDLGYGDLGCYGHPKFKTPNLDRMAQEGARLTDFYVPVPYCAPTRASLLTGRYPPRCGLTRNPFPAGDPQVKDSDDIGLPLTEHTLGQLFQQVGYRTSCIGKWHLGHKPRFLPTRRGFDDYFGILYSNDMHPVELFDGERKVEYPVVQTTLTRRYTERALYFIEQNKDRPFFLYFAQAMPHKPLAVGEAFYQKSGAGLYGDVIAELDDSVGQVLSKLKALNLDRQTLVLFTSDNGPWYGGSSGGLRGMKGMSWEGGLRVPLIARWPGKVPAGHVSSAPAITPDLFVTALAAAGIATPEGRVLDGKDLWPVLTSKASSPHEALFFFRGDRLHAVRSGQWKLHLLPPGPPKGGRIMKPDEKWVDPRGPDGVRILAPFEQAHPSQFPGLPPTPVTVPALFELRKDPGEEHNLAEKEPDTVRRLQGLAEKWLAGLRE